MRYVSVCDDITRFHWEIEVLIGNFKSVGLNPNKIEIVLLHNGTPSAKALEIQRKHADVRFFFYPDDRLDKSYIAAKKPWGMFKHLSAYPDLNKEAIFYHDTDIVFSSKLNEGMLERTDAWFLSNCEGYIGYDYIVSKGEGQFYEMCKIIGISPDVVRFNEGGGAQYVIKNSTPAYWLKVYEDSNRLYKYLLENNKGVQGCIQVWTAEMWATLWVAWQFGFHTRISKELNFLFATNRYDETLNCKIMHNAGVTHEAKDRMFYKGAYTHQYPLNLPEYDKTLASYFYVEQIKKYVS